MGLDRIMAYVGLDGSGFEVGAKRVESAADKLGHNINHHLRGAIAGAIGVAAIEEAIRHTVEFGARITDLSQRLGLTAEKFQELAFAFKTTGGSEQGMISFLERLSTSREKALAGTMASPAMLKNFSRLGVSQADLNDGSSDKLMSIIGKAIAEGNIENLRAPLRAVGGKGAGELIAGFKAGLEEKAAEARKAGQVMSNALAFQMKEVEERGKMLSTHLMNELAPAIVFVLKRFEDFTDGLAMMASFVGGITSKMNLRNLTKLGADATKTGVTSGLGAFSILEIAKGVLGMLADGKDAGIDAFIAKGKEIADRRDEEQKRIDAASIAPKQTLEIPAPDAKPDKFKSDVVERDSAIPVDSLQKIGGFVGVGAEMPMINIAKEQLTELRKIAKNTEAGMSGDSVDDSLIDGD